MGTRARGPRLFRFQRYRTTSRVGFWLMVLRLREPVRFQTNTRTSTLFSAFSLAPSMALLYLLVVRSTCVFVHTFVHYLFFMFFFFTLHNDNGWCYSGCNVKYETLHPGTFAPVVSRGNRRDRALPVAVIAQETSLSTRHFLCVVSMKLG